MYGRLLVYSHVETGFGPSKIINQANYFEMTCASHAIPYMLLTTLESKYLDKYHFTKEC